MIKRILLTACCFLGITAGLQAQLTRFQDVCFSGVKVTANITYGSNVPFAQADPQDLKLDIYEPAGDTMKARPVIIFIHSGSFLNANLQGGRVPAGTKEDNWLKHACTHYARRGYVTVALTHRLGWNPTLTSATARAKSIFEAVWRARQDLKAGVRFLNKEKATYRIDTERIAAGGSSSGAYVALHAEYLNKPAELSYPKFLDENALPFIDTTKLGNFEGASGNPGFKSKIHTLLCLGGAVGDTNFIEAGDPPVIAAHGVADATTPYFTRMVVTATGSIPIIEVSGSHDLIRTSTRLGNQKRIIDAGFNDRPFPGLLPFENENFEFYNWWNTPPTPDADARLGKLNSVLDFITPRLYSALNVPVIRMNGTVGKAEILENNFSLFPNPVGNELYLTGENLHRITYLTLIDPLGRNLPVQFNTDSDGIRIETHTLPTGIYFLKAGNETEGDFLNRKIIINR